VISPFQVSASGSIQQSAVDMTTVEALIHATDNLMIYLGLATFFSGTAISLALTLFADIDHPIPVYLALTAALSLTVAMVFVLSREFSRVRSLRTALRTSAGTLNFTITPVTGGPVVSSAPSTTASAEDILQRHAEDAYTHDDQNEGNS
jgi:hypothetical protein